ncbi:MAG: hypothetical protein KatS3mg065_0937 [Chloroflexota bacterium]|nr:MAG: hypothetical protein KatS3mg065_0937 [Chloroflexota bacterium]
MRRSLALLSLQHALIHAQGALLPLVFVRIVEEFEVGVDAIGLVVGLANLLNGQPPARLRSPRPASAAADDPRRPPGSSSGPA